MCKAYDELSVDQKGMFDSLLAHIDEENPEDWLPIIDALRAHLEIETFVQVPYRGGRSGSSHLKVVGAE
ncbi:MAG: hypothetical protein GY748_16445 [Planctomycetaceae bacterium]|nr:hypothetical protein [Planctomycetaceae bacterium]